MLSEIYKTFIMTNSRGRRPAGHIPQTRSGNSFDISKGKRCFQNRTVTKVDAKVPYITN